MNVRQCTSVHLIGAGGINMSAVGKLLHAAGVRVSGSDVKQSEQTDLLASRGATITIGEDGKNIPSDCELVIYTSAAPETNLERVEARKRNIPELTNFQFLGSWFADDDVILVTGTHGKSTTTAMLGLILEKAGLDPTVIVGSKVPGFADGNLRLPTRHSPPATRHSDLVVIEGDEYARHFLEFQPKGIVINNIELDHTDVFATLDIMKDAFRELIGKVKENGLIVANTGSVNVASVLELEATSMRTHHFDVTRFGGVQADAWQLADVPSNGSQRMTLSSGAEIFSASLIVPGRFNAENAAGAALMARALGANDEAIRGTLASFAGIWRRFELVGEKNGCKVFSDYAHHPTAVRSTLEAATSFFPGARIIACFQPHHRKRTKDLFFEFIPCFDAASALVLCEIYDVAGRDADEDEAVSSRDLLEAVTRHDAERLVTRTVEYAPDPASAIKQTFELAKPGDIVMVMGAGDIDGALRAALS